MVTGWPSHLWNAPSATPRPEAPAYQPPTSGLDGVGLGAALGATSPSDVDVPLPDADVAPEDPDAADDVPPSHPGRSSRPVPIATPRPATPRTEITAAVISLPCRSLDPGDPLDRPLTISGLVASSTVCRDRITGRLHAVVHSPMIAPHGYRTPHGRQLVMNRARRYGNGTSEA